MRKLVAGTIVVLAALALILWQLREPDATPTPSPQQVVAARIAPAQANLAAAAKKVAEAQAQSGKLDPASDAFFYREEAIVPRFTAQAADCYTGGLRRVHRNAKVKLGFAISIKDGVISAKDVRVIESTISDKALEACFVKQVAQTSWRDDEMPDYLSKDEEMVIRPERGMKKFTKENREYQGDGPIGKLVDADYNATAARELPREPREN